MEKRIEGERAIDAGGAGAGDGGGDDGGSQLVGAGGDVDGMDALEIAAVFLGAHDEIHGAGGKIDDGRGGDADVADDVETVGANYVGDGNRGDARGGVGEVVGPESGGAVGVEGVNDVVHGGDVEDILHTDAGNRDAMEIERLGLRRAADGVRPKLAEGIHADVSGGEGGF